MLAILIVISKGVNDQRATEDDFLTSNHSLVEVE